MVGKNVLSTPVLKCSLPRTPNLLSSGAVVPAIPAGGEPTEPPSTRVRARAQYLRSKHRVFFQVLAT